MNSFILLRVSQLTRQLLCVVSLNSLSQESNDGPLGQPMTLQSDIRSPNDPLNILQSILVLSYINHSQLDGYTFLQKSWQVCTSSTLPNSQIRFRVIHVYMILLLLDVKGYSLSELHHLFGSYLNKTHWGRIIQRKCLVAFVQ